MKRLLFFILMLLTAACGTKETPSLPPEPVKPPEAAAKPVITDTRPIIVTFGDSLSAGYGAETGASYPDFLQKLIDAGGYKYRVVNQGLSGDTTSGGLTRVGQAIELKPYMVILELGGNDGLRGLPISVTRDNLDKMITAFKDAGIVVVLAGMTLPRNYGPEYIHEFEQVYPALEKKHNVKRIRFLLEKVALKKGLMQRDEIHPTAEGNKIVAKTVFEVVEPLLKK